MTKTLSITVSGEEIDVTVSEPSVVSRVYALIGTGGGGGGGAVDSVNGQTGVVVLGASDVGAVPTTRTVTAGTGLSGGGALSANITLATTYGTTSGTSCQGNDSRLSDSRTPSGSAGGDLTGTYPNPTLATSGVTAATYGSATAVPVLTIDAKGRVAGATTAAITTAPSRMVMGAEIIPAVTNGCLVNSSSTTTNGVTYDTVDFDSATQQTGWVSVVSPKGWAGSTITITPHWTADSGSGGVVWGFAARFLADGDSIDQASGTEQTSTDTFQGAAIEHVGPATSAITPAGTAAGERLITVRVRRNPSDASDTLAVSARLISFTITWG